MTDIALHPATCAQLDAPPSVAPAATWAAAIVFGCAITLTVAGYQFGGSNHTVYLLDALHHVHPELLARDWFTTRTLQYHALFGLLTRGLMRLHVLEPAFLIGYLATVVLLQVAWAGIARSLRCSPATYLVGVVLYYALAGGTGLGLFSLEQDGAFLPSNVAAVALLWATYLYVAGRLGWSWVCVGVAGVFHLDHAVTGCAVWSALTLLQWRRARSEWVGIAIGMLLCVVNVALAARAVLGRSGKLPLNEFVDLYVHLRHPHHMDVRTWPIAVWAAFVVPVIGGAIAVRFAPPADQWRRFRQVFIVFLCVIAVALVTAGFWILGETFVQMQWYRFSVYPKLLGCVASGWAIGVAWQRWPRRVLAALAVIVAVFVALALSVTGDQARVVREVLTRHTIAIGVFVGFGVAGLVVLHLKHGPRRLFVVVLILSSVAIASGWSHLGLRPLPTDDADYLAVCDWARDNTPADALFVVPPGEQSFRLMARRAIVVNFKGIPQLSGEVVEWRDRMEAVTGVADLTQLRGTFEQKLGEMNRLYTVRSETELAAVARRYHADYVVAPRPWDGAEPVHHVGPYWVYRVQ